MTTIGDIWVAMRHGKEIANPATWKNRQNTINLLMSLAGVAVFLLKFAGLEFEITDEQLLIVATGIATILGGVNSIMTTASSSKIGLKKTVKK